MTTPETATSVRLRRADREIMALKLERDELKAIARFLMAIIDIDGPQQTGDDCSKAFNNSATKD